MTWEKELQRCDAEGFPLLMQAEIRLKAQMLRDEGIPTLEAFAAASGGGPEEELRACYQEAYGEAIAAVCREAERRIDADRSLARVLLTEEEAYRLYDRWSAAETGTAECYNAYAEKNRRPPVKPLAGGYEYLGERLAYREFANALRVHLDLQDFMEFVLVYEYPKTKSLIACAEGRTAGRSPQAAGCSGQELPQEGEFWLLQGRSLVRITASPVELADDGSLCCVYLDFDNPVRPVVERLSTFLARANRLYES